MKYCVLDTEGSGLFRYKDELGNPVPADAEGQPRLAELVMIFANEDLEIESEYQAYVRPDGWEMSEGATKVNGLTTEFLRENGVAIADVLGAYTAAINDGRIIVAHNAQHDCKQMRAELRRAGMPDLFEQTPNFCTMRALTDVCCILNARGNGWKWPKLSEACVHFGLDALGDHTAMADARAVLMLMREMKKRGILPDAKVHYARQRAE